METLRAIYRIKRTRCGPLRALWQALQICWPSKT